MKTNDVSAKRFKGRVLYQPSGKAAEYSPWAVNFYTGCSNDCDYCYCKRGVLSHVWSTDPKLKKGLGNGFHAIEVFKRELWNNLEEVRKTGIFFSFTTDPLLPETRYKTFDAADIALINKVPVKILTKRADWLDSFEFKRIINPYRPQNVWRTRKRMVAFGFTLTGADELEPTASTNVERIEAMKKLHEMGFKTFASIEPIITPAKSLKMIEATKDYCNLYKIGLISGKGKDYYNDEELRFLFGCLCAFADNGRKIYLKDSFLEFLDICRNDLPKNFVNSDYNIFNQ